MPNDVRRKSVARAGDGSRSNRVVKIKLRCASSHFKGLLPRGGSKRQIAPTCAFGRVMLVNVSTPCIEVTYFHDVTVENVPDGQTLLDVSILHRIPHLHQCGAQARCTTCRVQILDGMSHLSAPSPIEQEVASKRGWDAFTRLACQTRVHGAVVIRKLLDNPQDIIVLDLDELHEVDAGEGKELELAVLFSDIRNFTTYVKKTCPTTSCTS